jgi:hypothetical protein
MPSKTDLTRAGRHDLARAVERRGGLYATAAAVGWAMPTRAGAAEWAAHVSLVAAETGLSGTNGLFEAAAASYRRSGAKRDVEEAREEADTEFVFAGAGGPALPTQPPAAPAAGAKVPRSLRDEIDAW